MIPLGDENPTMRRPLMTYAIVATLALVWIFVQGAGLSSDVIAASVCNWGMVPGEMTRFAPVGDAIPMGDDLVCVVDRDPINVLTPLTSMFLHGGWAHLLGNGLFLWVFGDNVEDCMGRLRFFAFYMVCGLVAALAQILVDPSSIVPMVGASGAISGVLGAYLMLFPRARINMLFVFFIFFRVIPLPAWLVLLWWIGWQMVAGLPQLMTIKAHGTGGVAVFAHIGGFFAGMVLVKMFVSDELLRMRARLLRRGATRWG
jgi:membrane associated rhomboid family serine protease